MSSKPLFRLLLIVAALVLPLLFSGKITLGQPAIEAWTSAFSERLTKPDYTAYQADLSAEETGQIPGLSSAVPELDALEIALQPWGSDKALENTCMELMMDRRTPRILYLNQLWGLYRSSIEIQFSKTDLPTSFQWLPAMLSQLDHAASPQEKNVGLWKLSLQDAGESGLLVNSDIDERFIPGSATSAAIVKLQKLQRRFPNEPARVLVGYFKGMAFATRWSGVPGYDADLDAWLAMYKVISRLMVNLDLPDSSVSWAQTLSTWTPFECGNETTRSAWLARHPEYPAEVLNQLIPWWIGEQLRCEVLEAYDARLPAETQPRAVEVDAVSIPAIEQADDYQARFSCDLHEVKQGDTLWNISKRYPGTTPEWIAEVNQIEDYIRIGQVLCIPKIK